MDFGYLNISGTNFLKKAVSKKLLDGFSKCKKDVKEKSFFCKAS